MKFGACCGFDKIELLESLGFDYIEGHVTAIAAMSDAEFEAVAEKLENAKIKCEACCVLFPGSVRVTGPEFDEEKIKTYLDGAFARLGRLGVESVVFGSGGARKVPEGFDRAVAWHQLITVGRILAEKAAEHNLTIALEPLNKSETNIINTQREGLALVADVDRPSFKILSDFYHVWLEHDGREDIAACKGLLQHIHMANPIGRVYLAQGDEVSYEPFFAGLADCGYTGRLSFEGNLVNEEAELASSLAIMKAHAEKYGL